MSNGASSGQLPPHKLIPHTGLIVDGFKYRSPLIKAYILSHAHSDHYTGLRDTWDYGPIYCSEVTGKLIVRILGVSPDLIQALEWDTPTQVEGVEVTLIDANHCPGAAQVLFKLATGEAYVHCGDMRFGPHLLENPHLQRFQGCNAMFLDTTYCNPKYTFPPQEEAVEYIASTIHELLNKQDGKRRLFLIQTYVIGKEHILIEVNRRCNRKIFVSDKKLSFMECIQMPGLDTEKMFTTNPDETAVHVTQWGWLGESWPFFRPNFVNMETARKEMGVDEVIGFCPTGWMYEMKRSKIPVKTKGPNSIHLVPYSEHSSYNELREYVRFLKPHKVIPTVGVDGENADRNARAMLKHFRNLVNETASKASFLAAFKRGDSSTAAEPSPSRASSGDEPAALEENDAATAELDTCKDADAGELDSREPGGNPGPMEELEHPGEEDTTPAEMPGTVPQPAGIQPKRARNRDGTPAPSLQTVSMSVKHEQQQHAEEMELEPPAETPNTEAIHTSGIKPEVNQTSGSQLELSLQPWAGGTGPHAAAASQQRVEMKQEEDQEAAEGATGVIQREGDASTSGQTGSQTEQLCSILGGVISEQAADKLLLRCGGDLAKAVNAFYDSGTSGQSTALTGAKKLNPQKPQSSPKANAAKRKAGTAKTPQKQPKLAKLSADQRQITAFFGQGRSQVPAKGSTGNAAAPEPILLDDDPDDEDVAISSSSPDEGRQSQPASQAAQPQQVEVDDVVADAKPEAAAKPTLRLPPAPIFASARMGSSKLPISTAKPKEEDPAAATQLERVPASRQSASGTKAARQVVPDRSAEVPADAVLKSVKEYQPVEMAIWAQGQAAPYLHIGRALAAMDSTTKRLRISDVIANMFRSLLALSPEDILPAAYLVTGKLAPDYEGVEMNVGGSIVSGAVIEATGVTRQRLSAMYRELGDLGDVAQACRHNQATLQKPAPLTVRGVFKTMKQIAAEKGNGSGTRKQRAVLGLLRSAREEEPKYIVRTLISNLRVGANWRSVMPGLARAFLLHEKGPHVSKAEMDAASAQVSEAFHLCPNLDVLVPALQAGGLAELERRCTLKAGVPLKPMLAKICEGIPDALSQLRGEFLAEFKYDGQRSQIHLLPNGSVKLFSRNCEDKTAAFPDVVEMVQQAAQGGAKELVMDTELVAIDRTDGNRLRAFQELSTRARGQTELHQVSVQVCVFVFDILMVDGDVLIKRSLRERRACIALALPNMRPGYIQLAQSLQLPAPPAVQPKAATGQKTNEEDTAQDGEETEGGGLEASVQNYLLESFASGTEGLMLKALDTNATYQASKRSESWLKIKKDYCEGLRDSLDLVPIGAWYGQGRKTGWFSPFLLAAWDLDKEEFQSVCRCMSGFTDAFYTEATERLSKRQCERKSYYNTGESPSVWFEPGEVWEIRGADLTISPVHRAAIGCIDANPERGVSLRFPRYIRTREDKTIEEASSPEVITDLYNKQSRKMSSAKAQLEAQKRQDKAAQQADSGSDTAEAKEDNQEADPRPGMDAE